MGREETEDAVDPAKNDTLKKAIREAKRSQSETYVKRVLDYARQDTHRLSSQHTTLTGIQAYASVLVKTPTTRSASQTHLKRRRRGGI